MEITQQRRLLTGMAGALLLGAVAGGAWSFMPIPTELSGVDSSGAQSSFVVAPPSQEPEPLNVDLELRLGSTLFDKPVAPPAAPVETPKLKPPVVTPSPRKNPLELTLVGTLIQSGESVAMIADASGKVDVARAGQSLDLLPAGVVVQEIDSESVTLRYQGQDSVMRLQKALSGSSGANGGGRRGANGRRN
ncbi:type II secretion system protein N [Stieleria varia]|nr:type II secretion system protein N [Stieleria varia]